LVSQRTGIVNQIRAFLLERGIAVRQGLRFLRAELPGILAMRTDVLSPRMSRIIEALALDWRHLDARIEGLSDEIETLACQDPHCERLMTVPGIGPIISSAMGAASEDPLPLDFRRDRDHHHRIDTLVATRFRTGAAHRRPQQAHRSAAHRQGTFDGRTAASGARSSRLIAEGSWTTLAESRSRSTLPSTVVLGKAASIAGARPHRSCER
jgi:transposase